MKLPRFMNYLKNCDNCAHACVLKSVDTHTSHRFCATAIETVHVDFLCSDWERQTIKSLENRYFLLTKEEARNHVEIELLKN